MMRTGNTDTRAEAITEAGTRVFAELGYHRTTVEDILREADVARSTFYSYFSNKHELFAVAVNGLMGEILANVDGAVDSIVERFGARSVPPDDVEVEQALVDMMVGVFYYIRSNMGMTRIFLHEMVGIDEDMNALFGEFQKKLVDSFERLIRFGEEISVIRELNQPRAAEFIVGGLVYLARNISAGIGDYDIEEVSTEFVELQLRGLLMRPGTDR